MKKISALIAAVAMAATITACNGGSNDGSRQVNGTAAETVSAVHDYTYVTSSGNTFSGTYTGGWENGQPNGEGTFEGEGEKGKETVMGNWSNGKPHGQCKAVRRTDTGVRTWSGEYFYGEMQGNGSWKSEDLNGNLLQSYSGEWKNNKPGGIGEISYYYNDEEAAEYGFTRRVYKGGFSDSKWNGEGELTIYYTKEYAEQVNTDYIVYTGQAKDDSFVEPYRYARYKNNQIVEEGRVRDGKRISDAEKAKGDFAYDLVDDALGDGILGDLFDIIAPEFYDRNAE